MVVCVISTIGTQLMSVACNEQAVVTSIDAADRYARAAGLCRCRRRGHLAEFKDLVGAGAREQVRRAGDDAGPAGLMICTQAGAVVAVKYS